MQNKLELFKLLEKHDLVVESAAKDLSTIIKSTAKLKSEAPIKEKLSKLRISKSGILLGYDDFKNIILSNANEFKSILKASVPHEMILEILHEEMKRKEAAQKDIGDQRRNEYLSAPSEDYANGQKYMYEDIVLFENKFNIKPNSADVDLYSCFQNAAGNIIFKTDSSSRVILTKSDCSLDFKGELMKIDEKSSFISDLDQNFSEKYNGYLKILIYILKGLTENDLSIREDDPDDPRSSIGILESIFLNGYKIDNETFKVPASFRHIIKLKKKYELIEDGNGKKFRSFQGIKVFPFNQTLMPSLEFDNFIEYFSKNFVKMTKGAITISNNLKVYSNYPEDTSLTFLPKPTEWENSELPPAWSKFFNGKASSRLLDRIFCYIGMCLDSDNHAQQILLISDEGMTGKGELVRLLQDLLPHGMLVPVTNANIQNDRFAVTACSLYKAHIIVNTEYDGKVLNSTLIKQISGGDIVMAEIKNGGAITWNTYGTKIIFTSNEKCYLNDHAIRRRIIPVSFSKNFSFGTYTEEYKKELIDQGDEFLKYCWKRYKKSPFIQKDGSYLVLNAEQAKDYVNNRLDLSDYSKILLKAFSRDEELSDKFDISSDFDESGANDVFNELYETFFEYSDNYEDVIIKTEMPIILNKIFANTLPNVGSKYSEKLKEFVKIWSQKFGWNSTLKNLDNHSHGLMQWNKFLEKTKVHKLAYDVYLGKQRVRAFHNIRVKNTTSFSEDDFEELDNSTIDYSNFIEIDEVENDEQ